MFYNKLRDMTWQSECDMQTPYRVMTAQIGFAHEECSSDEVEFCIVAWDAKELDKLFTVFCKENHFYKTHTFKEKSIETSSRPLTERR